MTLEHCRKDAKALVRAHRAGEPEAVARAREVLGNRERFQLSDAQHVLAVERGYRTWAELRRELEARVETLVDSGLEYRPGDAVRVKVVKRGRRYLFTDGGAAVALAGTPPGWRDAAQRAVDEDGLNLSRSGAVFVPAFEGRCSVESLAQRVARLSLAVYQEILDLQEGAGTRSRR
jgi:hypothetical protein